MTQVDTPASLPGREDLGHLRYGAIMLTDLLPRTSWLNGGHIAVGRQYLSQQLSRDFVGARLTQRSVTRLDVIDSSLSHRVKSRGARCIGKLSKGRYRQVVVGSVIVGTPVIGQEGPSCTMARRRPANWPIVLV
jgi:hypothetical protein